MNKNKERKAFRTIFVENPRRLPRPAIGPDNKEKRQKLKEGTVGLIEATSPRLF